MTQTYHTPGAAEKRGKKAEAQEIILIGHIFGVSPVTSKHHDDGDVFLDGVLFG